MAKDKQTSTSSYSNMRALLTLTKYNFLATIRNPSALFFSFLFPLVFIAIFGLLSGGERSFEIAVRPASAVEGILNETLLKVDVVSLVPDLTDVEIDDKLNKGDLAAAMTITNVPNSQKQTVLLELSGAEPQDAQTILSIVNGIVNGVNSSTQDPDALLIDISTEEVAGRKYSQIDFILPGQLAFALLTSGVMGVSFTFLTLRKTLVIKRIFATPASRWVIILSEALSKLVIAVLQAVVILLVGVYAFDFTLANGAETFINMLILSAIGLLVFLSMGLLASSIAESEDALGPVTNIMTLPQFLLSGAFFPIEVLPDFVQPIAQVMPMRFLVNAMRTVSFEGASLLDVAPDILALVIWGVILYAITTRLFKWS